MSHAEQAKTYEADVAIIGLGPVGALLTNLLIKSGLTVVALDREPDVMKVPRGVGIDGEIMRVVQAIGLTDELLPFLRVFGGAQYLDSEGAVIATRPAASHSGDQAWADRYNVHQPEFEDVLRIAMRKHPSCTELVSHEVYSVQNVADGVEVQATDLNTQTPVVVKAKYAVGTDGGRSITRRMISSSYTDYGLNEPWIVADFEVNDQADLPLINTHFADPVSPAIYIRVVRNIRRFEFRGRPGEDLETAVTDEKIWDRVSRWVKPEEATLIRSAVYTHRALVVDTWRDGNILLAGDSAHQTPPFLGQGLCTGVRDAVSLAWRLRDVILCGTPASILDSYGPERGAHAKHFISTATELGSKLGAPSKEAIDKLNSRIGREGRGTKPRLGAGLFDQDFGGGYLAPQMYTAASERVDDLVGYEFGAIISEAYAAEMTAEVRNQFVTSGIALVVASGAAQEWLMHENAVGALVRPDRYTYGMYPDAAAFEAGLNTLLIALGANATSELDTALTR